MWQADGILTPGYQGRFIDSLASCCEQVVCFLHSPRPEQLATLDCRLASANVQLVDIGRHCSAYRRTLFARHYAQGLAEWQGQLDVMLCRGPSPLLPAFSRLARRFGMLPTLLLVGNYLEGIDDLPQPRWRKELIRAWSRLNQAQQDKAAMNSLTFVNSRRLFEQYAGRVPLLFETRTTTLSDQDFFERLDTCQAHPVRLLYVGRFDRAKGLLEIVEALSLLVRNGHDILLDLVGWDDSGTGVEAEIEAFAEKLGVTKRLVNHGRLPLGPELFARYRAADIFVNASKTTEGFPRTIWEAMAQSLPVVATAVGSIPHYVADAAMLVPPCNVTALAEGIESIIVNQPLRRRLIVKGLELALENTLERRSREMISILQDRRDEMKRVKP